MQQPRLSLWLPLLAEPVEEQLGISAVPASQASRARGTRRPGAGAGRDARRRQGSAGAAGACAVRAGLRAWASACAQGPRCLALPGAEDSKSGERERARGPDSSMGSLGLRNRRVKAWLSESWVLEGNEGSD